MQYMYLNGNGTFDHQSYTGQMCTGVDFLRNHDDTTAVDLPSFHLYPDHHAEELCGRGAPQSDCALQVCLTHAFPPSLLPHTHTISHFFPIFFGERRSFTCSGATVAVN